MLEDLRFDGRWAAARLAVVPPSAPPRVRLRTPSGRSAGHTGDGRRAEAFARAFHRRLGPGRLISPSAEEGRDARAEAAGGDGGFET